MVRGGGDYGFARPGNNAAGNFLQGED